MSDDFDRQFYSQINSQIKLARSTAIWSMIANFSIICVTIAGVIYGVIYVSSHGLKSAIDRLWTGPTNQTTIVTE